MAVIVLVNPLKKKGDENVLIGIHIILKPRNCEREREGERERKQERYQILYYVSFFVKKKLYVINLF